MKPRSPLPGVALALALWLLAPPSHAHDTWFEPVAGPELQLLLGTGDQFPKQESGIDRIYLAERGCRAADGTGVALGVTDDAPAALRLRPGPGASTCWAQLQPFEIVVAPALVEVYLKEIAASPAVRTIWAGREARGVPWKERYTKHARVELASGGVAGPVGLGLDIVPAPAASPRQVGETLVFQVLRDGQPLAGFAIELRSATVRFGRWGRTDAEGRVVFKAPLPGRWLLRGVDLRVSATDPDAWDSRFVTLAFTVAPRTAAP